MLENRVTLETQLLGADGHGHLDVVNFPFRPGAAVHPYAAVLHPFLVFKFVDGCEHGIGADLVGAVGIGKVTGNENLMRLHIFEQALDNINVDLRKIAFLDGAGLVERKARGNECSVA